MSWRDSGSGVSTLSWIALFLALITIPTEEAYSFTILWILCALSIDVVDAFRSSMYYRISASSTFFFRILMSGSMVMTKRRGEKASPLMMPFVSLTSPTSFLAPYDSLIFHRIDISMIRHWTPIGKP